MVSKTPTFRDYVNVVRRTLEDEFSAEFIAEISDDYTISELKVAEFIINDNVEYNNAIYVAIEEDHNGDIRLTVGNALSNAGIYEFDDIQAKLHKLLQNTRHKIRELHDSHKLFAVLYPVPNQKVRAYPTISILDYGVYHTDDVGNRWSMFLPLAETEYYFDGRPSLYVVEQLLRWAVRPETLGMVFGWLADYVINEIDELNRLVEDSWSHYYELTGE